MPGDAIVEKKFRRKRALLIGVSGYGRIKPLHFAHRDAQELGKALVEHLRFEGGQVTVLSDESPLKPTRSEILEQLHGLQQLDLGPEDLLVFQFSGHGLRDTEANEDYLLPADATLHSIRETGLSIGKIVKELQATGCGHIVLLLDMCREEIEEGAKGLVGVGVASQEVVDRPGIATFFSCDPREYSYEIDAVRHGSFTYCVLEAIRAKAAGTIGELYAHLKSSVPRLNSGNAKRPQLPLLVANPHDIAELVVFRVLAEAAAESGTTLALKDLTACVAAKKLSGEYFVEALRLLELPSPTIWERAKLNLVQEYCSDQLTLDKLNHAWRVLNKQAASPTQIQGITGFGRDAEKGGQRGS